MNKIKIVHILHSIEFSGAEIMLYQANEIFARYDLQTTLLSCSSKKGSFEGQMTDVGYQVEAINDIGSLTFLYRFFKYFQKHHFDIVHMHTERLYLWKIILLRITGHKNIVRSYHNNWSFEGTLRLKRIIHRKLASLLGVKNHAIGDAVKKNEENTFYNKCVTINNWIKINSGLISDKTAVRAKKRLDLGIEPTAYVIISIGGCSPIKNHKFIIKLLAKLAQEKLNVKYLHVGTGADESEEIKIAETNGENNHIIFAGIRKDIPELLMCADLFMMPSLFEGLSIALLEAMCYGGLALVNDAPGLNNVIVHKSTGYVIDVNDESAYLQLIRSLTEKKIDTKAIEHQAREFVKQNFDMERNVTELIKYYMQNTALELSLN